MPLNVQQLTQGLAAIFKSQPGSGSEAANKIAAEYDKYCKAGMAAPGAPVFVGVEAMSLEGPLAGALGSGNGTAAAVAAAYATGIQTYWLVPPVVFIGGPASGLATAMPGAGAAVPLITTALSNTQNTEDSIASQIATALDTATKTVLVTFTTPPPPLGPPPPATVV